MGFPLLAVLLSAAGTFGCIRLLPRLGFIDLPGSRRVHTHPIPRGGGLAIIAAFFICALLFGNCQYTDGVLNSLRVFWPPAAVILALGLLDDRFGLKAPVKLAAQIAAGFLVWWKPFCENPHRLESFLFALPPWASCAVTVFLVVAIINAFNLIDGLDGLAAGLSVVSALCLALWAVMVSRRIDLMIVYLILAGACVGFLRYNFSPARIFMGDTGSNFLGLFFAVGCLDSMTAAATTVSVLVPLMAVGVPIFDVFLAFWRRLLRRIGAAGANGGIMQADMDHLHHRIYAKNHDQRKTALLLYFIACLFALSGAAVMLIAHGRGALGYFIVILTVVLAVRRFATVELMDSAKMLVSGMHRPRRGMLIMLCHPFFDLMCLAAAHVAANLIMRMPPFYMTFSSLPFVLVLFATLLAGGIYRIYWLRASVRDYRFLCEMFFLGSLLSLLANRLFDGPWNIERAVLFFMFAGMAIIGERLLLHYIESFMIRQIFLRRLSVKEKVDDAMIFGAGQGCRTFLSDTGYMYEDLFNIVGIIDDDTTLHGMYIYGHRVIGGRTDLEKIWNHHRFDRLIVTSYRIEPEVIESLRRFAADHHIKIYRFKAEAIEI